MMGNKEHHHHQQQQQQLQQTQRQQLQQQNQKQQKKRQQKYLDNSLVAYTEFGDAEEVLRLFRFREEIKSEDEIGDCVIVQVEASSVSMMDCLLRRNLYSKSITFPYKTGCDLVGRVIHVGSRCKTSTPSLSLGDRVCTLGLKLGGNARYAVVPATSLLPCPTDLEAPVIACLLRTYATAYQCLHSSGRRKIAAGDRVLVIGGAGSVGQAVMQLARLAGASEVRATGRGQDSRKIIERLGGRFLEREPEKWLPFVEGRMDFVIDTVCSDGYVSSRRAVRTGTGIGSETGTVIGSLSGRSGGRDSQGLLVCVGATSVLSVGNSWVGGLPLAYRCDRVKAALLMDQTWTYDVFDSFQDRPVQFRNDLRMLFNLVRHGMINPKVARCIPLDQIATAHRDLEHGGIDGTIVCLPFAFDGPSKMQPFSSVSMGGVEDNRDDNVTTYTDGIQVRPNGDENDDGTLLSTYTHDYSRDMMSLMSYDYDSTYGHDDDDDDTATNNRREQTAKSTSGPGEPLHQSSTDPFASLNSKLTGSNSRTLLSNSPRKVSLFDDDDTLNRDEIRQHGAIGIDFDYDNDESVNANNIKFSDKTIADSVYLRKQHFTNTSTDDLISQSIIEVDTRPARSASQNQSQGASLASPILRDASTKQQLTEEPKKKIMVKTNKLKPHHSRGRSRLSATTTSTTTTTLASNPNVNVATTHHRSKERGNVSPSRLKTRRQRSRSPGFFSFSPKESSSSLVASRKNANSRITKTTGTSTTNQNSSEGRQRSQSRRRYANSPATLTRKEGKSSGSVGSNVHLRVKGKSTNSSPVKQRRKDGAKRDSSVGRKRSVGTNGTNASATRTRGTKSGLKVR